MGQRMVVVMACMTAVVIPLVAAERETSVVRSTFEYLEGQDDLPIDELLAREYQSPLTSASAPGSLRHYQRTAPLSPKRTTS